MLEVLFPSAQTTTVGGLLDGLGDEPLAVGDERICGFLTGFGRRLVSPAVARRHPALASLGFFLRRSELVRTLDSLRDSTDRDRLRVPRGLVFHIPPANVDTVFVYSWALSALMGNLNVVRLSRRAGPVANVIMEALADAARDADPVVARTQRVVTYDRSDILTAELSAACDLRVIWGGDRTVNEVRRQPLAPHARDVTFPDRSSFAVVKASAWLSAAEELRDVTAEGFGNDSYWFDQAACSSPRTVFWVGGESDCDRARADFTDRLATTVRAHSWTVDAAMAVEKRVATYGLAADGAATRIDFRGNALANLSLAPAAAPPRTWLGTGTFAHARLDRLRDLAGRVVRKDQTLTHFGFGRAELESLVAELAGRGVDRIVPIGSALAFSRFWDGMDLAAEFTQLVTVTV